MDLAKALIAAMDAVNNCDRCRNLTEDTTCHICRDVRRDNALLCVVESPVDVMLLEQATDYRGLFFVLLGSPVAVGWHWAKGCRHGFVAAATQKRAD